MYLLHTTMTNIRYKRYDNMVEVSTVKGQGYMGVYLCAELRLPADST